MTIEYYLAIKRSDEPRRLWLMLIILAMKEAEIRRIVVQSQPRANSS
jgi:hypothetical protein